MKRARPGLSTGSCMNHQKAQDAEHVSTNEAGCKRSAIVCRGNEQGCKSSDRLKTIHPGEVPQIMMVPRCFVCQIASRHWTSGVQSACTHSSISSTATNIHTAVCFDCCISKIQSSAAALHTTTETAFSFLLIECVTQQQCVRVNTPPWYWSC